MLHNTDSESTPLHYVKVKISSTQSLNVNAISYSTCISIISILAVHLCNTKNKASDRANDGAHPVKDVTA